MFSHKALALGLAVLILATVLPFLFDFKTAKKRWLRFAEDDNAMLTTALLSLFVAFLMLVSGWRVTKTWEGVMALVGWLALLRGLHGLLFPESRRRMVKHILDGSDTSVAILMFVAGLVGVGFGYLGLSVF